jgi:hypothetical protein
MLSIMDDTSAADARCPDLAVVDERLKAAARGVACAFLKEYSSYDACKESYTNKITLPTNFLDMFGTETSGSPTCISVMLYAFSARFLISRIRYSNLPEGDLVSVRSSSTVPEVQTEPPQVPVTPDRPGERWWFSKLTSYFW